MVRHSWRTRLKAAPDERAVVSIVALYLAEWSAAEIARVPRGAWTAAIDTPRGIVDQSVQLALVHARLDPRDPGLAALQELLLFFTHAAVAVMRLSTAGMEALAAR